MTVENILMYYDDLPEMALMNCLGLQFFVFCFDIRGEIKSNQNKDKMLFAQEK